MSDNSDLVLIVSDGSAGDGSSAVAVIIKGKGRRVKVVAALPKLTPVEAEYYGLIVAIEEIESAQFGSSLSVKWLCDNVSARVQGEQLLTKRKISGSVAAPSTESELKEHERCHRAASWVRKECEQLIRRFPNGTLGTVSSEPWKFKDWRAAKIETRQV